MFVITNTQYCKVDMNMHIVKFMAMQLRGAFYSKLRNPQDKV